MKMVIVAGTPGSGKTAVLIHALRSLKERGLKSSVVKIDCLYTDDGIKFEKIGSTNQGWAFNGHVPGSLRNLQY